MNLFDLFEISQLRAIHNALEPTLDSIWRMKCRSYSERFHTPLHVVMNELDPMMVLQALNEDKFHPSIVEEELEDLLDILYKARDPNYEKLDPQVLEDLVDNVINRELARKSKQKLPTPESIKADIVEAKPRSGKIHFSDLEKMESEIERGGSIT